MLHENLYDMRLQEGSLVLTEDLEHLLEVWTLWIVPGNFLLIVASDDIFTCARQLSQLHDESTCQE